ncbi:MAG: hypothetical protein ACRECX_11720 [Methyloceanibacter sp.]|uniref:hypothetical protein n=1 Tax=Methyloceanibacter sp. TaxID=1965321 RepID=UPI003D6CC6FA
MDLLGLTSDQVWLLVLGGVVLVLAYQVRGLREARKPRLKSKVLRELRFGKPIEVKHDSPRSLTPDGQERYGADKHDFDCFHSLWYFAPWVNKLYSDLSEPIRLQELRDTEIRGSRADEGPAYGRRYDIYYNRYKIGLLEICAGLGGALDPADKSVDVEITIDGVPPTTLPYSAVYGFLSTVASLVTSTQKPKYAHLPNGETEYDHALSTIRSAMTELMWNTHSGDHEWAELNVRLSGYPEYYYRVLQRRLQEVTQKAAAGARGV